MKKDKNSLVVSEIRNLDVNDNTRALLEEIFNYERDARNRSDFNTRITNVREKVIRGFNRETS